MIQIEDIDKDIIEFFQTRISCFKLFHDVASYRKIAGKQKAQFKTEKWLQTELVMFFWNKQYNVIPEFTTKRWDIYIHQKEDILIDYHLALVCLTDSVQSVNGDYINYLAEDLDSIATFEKQAALIVVLPWGRNQKYSEGIRNRIKSSTSYTSLSESEFIIPFNLGSPMGIKILLIKQ